jgi:16S rRNA U1498 N3-methylase RsmE
MNHLENLLRRYKDENVTIKSISGGVYEGRISEITNDYVSLRRGDGGQRDEVFLLYQSIESILPAGDDA